MPDTNAPFDGIDSRQLFALIDLNKDYTTHSLTHLAMCRGVAAPPPFALLLTRLALIHTAFAGAISTSSVDLVSAPTVDTPFGTVLGRAIGDSEQFLGLPYAEPPLADLPRVIWSTRW